MYTSKTKKIIERPIKNCMNIYDHVSHLISSGILYTVANKKLYFVHIIVQ